MATVNEFKESLRNHVLANATVSSLIDTRFYGSDLATLYLDSNSFPLSTFTLEAGDEQLVLQSFNMTVRTYSNKHYDESHEIYDAVRESLRVVNVDTKSLIYATGSPSEFYDEISRLYTVVGRFRVARLLR